MEMKGIEPLASRMQSARSTPELHPPRLTWFFFRLHFYMSLETYRSNIDILDDQILKLLEKRKTYSKKIGEIKQKHGLSVFLKGREEKILQRLKSNSKTLEYWEIDIIYNSIFKSSKSIQNNN